MDNEINKILENFYSNYNEENRLTRTNHNKLEFITSIKYIDKYLKPNDKILDIGAGTGKYSRYYANKGYEVQSVELLEHNINIFKNLINENMKINLTQGNATNLSNIKDNTFDITLCFGPLYHLFTEEEQLKAINEAIRVTKQNGILFFAFITNDAGIINNLLREKKLLNYQNLHDENYKLKNSPEEVFYLYEIEDFEKQMKTTNTKLLNIVATDGIAPSIRELIDGLDEENFNEWVNYHLARAEKRELLGYSCHILYVCKKS